MIRCTKLQHDATLCQHTLHLDVCYHCSLEKSETTKMSNTLSHTKKSYHIWTSHVAYECVMPLMNESCRLQMSHVDYEWVTSHINWVMSIINESCHTWISHVICKWVMSQMNELCHIWKSHITYEWGMCIYIYIYMYIHMSKKKSFMPWAQNKLIQRCQQRGQKWCFHDARKPGVVPRFCVCEYTHICTY